MPTSRHFLALRLHNLAQATSWACASILSLSMLTPAEAARVTGQVRDAATQRMLYTELHEQTLAADGSVQTALTTYLDPQGREIGRKVLDFRANRTVPRYRMDLPSQRYAEGITEVGSEVAMFKLDQGQEQRKRLPLAKGRVAADSGFNQLLLDQMPAIKAGETLAFVLIVPGKADQYQFRARKRTDPTPPGEAARLRVTVEPDSLLRWVVSPIELVYNAEGTRLLQYTGLSNVLDTATGQVYPRVQIQYGYTPSPEATASSSGSGVR
jgi:hypothetical protein